MIASAPEQVIVVVETDFDAVKAVYWVRDRLVFHRRILSGGRMVEESTRILGLLGVLGLENSRSAFRSALLGLDEAFALIGQPAEVVRKLAPGPLRGRCPMCHRAGCDCEWPLG